MSKSLSGGVGWRWPAAGLGALSAAVCAWDLLKEVAIIIITPTIVLVSGQTTEREHSPANQQKIGLKITEHNPPIRTRPSFPQVSLSHQEAVYSYPSEGRQNENHNHRKLIKLITWTTALSNSKKL